ncbi:Nuclear nucleic acid-binding protein C1D [Liparis tanakae]|uniref:Nuclear nucleic acid-binding protein C1D n=1 Tax=Liparis tanakae TaxID=230148 RepID=A0A4Z2EJE3_9TELE|nr:Nuclear nucleic acid-binding protein C1D [Liparis tanakae]
MAEESKPEDYPQEIDEQLASFGSSVSSVRTMLQQLMAMPRNELLKLEPLDQAKLDLMSAYTLNSLFWMYLVTQGVNPRDHGIKQELARIRTYMNKVKEITDRKKMARLDKDAAGRFLKSALYEPKDKDFRRKAPQEAPHRTPHGASNRTPLGAPHRTALGTPLGAPHRAPQGTPSGASKSKRPKRS